MDDMTPQRPNPLLAVKHVLAVSLIATALVFSAACVRAGTVTISPGTQYQTIKGWLAVGEIGIAPPTFQQQQMLKRAANELGITTLRLDLPFNGNNASMGHSWCLRIDNTNPSKANWASFDTLAGVQYDTTAADSLMTLTVLPFAKLVQARGDPFTMYTNPSFYNYGSTGPIPIWMQYNTGEYAEYLVSFAEYMAHKYGMAPDYMTIINEAGNSNNMTPALEASVIKAAGPMLAAAGLKTKIQLAECVNSTNSLSYAQDPSMDSETWGYVGTISWHDYGTQSSSSKASLFSLAQAQGVMTAQTETQLATFSTMYDDLVNGGVSYWGQYGLGGKAAGAGIQYYNTGLDGASMSVPSQYWVWRQIMNFVRPGAVRIGAASSDTIQTMAFQRNGKITVILSNQTSSSQQAESVTISNLPPGAYAASYAIPGFGTTEMGLQTVPASGALTVTVPWNSVMTIYPHAGKNLPPEIYQYAANPVYLKQGSGSSTTLTAAATDPELDPLSYAWSLASAPAGAAVSLSTMNSASTNANGLTVPGMYIFDIKVSDGSNIATHQVAIKVLVGNQPPFVDVVQSRSPPSPSPVVPLLLTQPQSSTWLLDQVALDLENDPLTYAWKINKQPKGASASLATPSALSCVASNLSMTGEYTFEVTVSDGITPVFRKVTVTVDPPNLHAPTIANASGSYVAPGQGQLQATTSDADGDWISSWWQVTSKPTGATVTFNDPASPDTAFSVDTPGSYTFQLSVVDRTLYTQSSPITVSILTVPGG